MKKINIDPRPDWKRKVEDLGFSFHSLDDIYWDESAAYRFSMEEILLLEEATNKLHGMCLDAVQHIIDNDLYNKLKIPREFIPFILRSWNNDDPSIYGRFDFCYDGSGFPKLLEYNADTPTSLFESSVVQWYWLQDYDSSKDQFNSIHEKLIAYWKMLKDYIHNGPVFFSSIDDSIEDIVTTQYMRDTALQAGLDTDFIYIKDIGWNGNYFTDLNESPIANIFKLYPWEWLINEDFGKNLLTDSLESFWIEPSWKMILSNKGFLPVLYKLNPDSPYLLKSLFDSDIKNPGSEFNFSGYVKKPILSREGANIQIFEPGNYSAPAVQTDGEYGEEGFILQELKKLPDFNGSFPVIGSWVIGGEAAGIGIRESDTLITTNKSRFIPHFID
jgi:glutathionylspermidine synthase